MQEQSDTERLRSLARDAEAARLRLANAAMANANAGSYEDRLRRAEEYAVAQREHYRAADALQRAIHG